MINLILLISMIGLVVTGLAINARLLITKEITDPFQVLDLAKKGHPLAKLYLRLGIAAVALFCTLVMKLLVFGV